MLIVRLSPTIRRTIIPAINSTNAPAMSANGACAAPTNSTHSRARLDTVALRAPQDVLGALEQLERATAAHLEASRAANTRRAYASDVGSFELWYGRHALVPLPAEAGAAVPTLRGVPSPSRKPTRPPATRPRRRASSFAAPSPASLGSAAPGNGGLRRCGSRL